MSIGIIGSGAFGSALGMVYAMAGHEVVMLSRNAATIDAINTTHENPARLPGIALDPRLRASAAAADLADVEALLMVLPAQQTRGFLAEHAATLPDCPIVACAKGIDRESGLFQSQILATHRAKNQIAVLSGPGFAVEIAAGKPTAMALASFDDATGRHLQGLLSSPSLRLYHNRDVLGTELGGALKNIIAIGCGVAIGAGLGQSARAALLTRGFAEMTRLAAAMGARIETVGGLAGLGDLTLTATSETSRNYALGLDIGGGTHHADGKTTEGAYTARVALGLAREYGLDLPVIETTARLVEGEIDTQGALRYLFSRPLKTEF